jgi:hypothetical protein
MQLPTELVIVLLILLGIVVAVGLFLGRIDRGR